MIGYICARSLPHFGSWNNFSPAIIAKLCTKPIIHPHPNISEQTEPESTWTIPILNLSDIVDPIIPEFMDDDKNNELEDASFVDVEFQFPIGWALKSNQKFGEKKKEKE
ncbi:hypothetical protein RclHR1_34240001 [Rhizophagus clarus]|uniref:Uncharacterized protein n=1 Tax=Rhizophagus clarus TaxID=94130 RepID=A0A2Z6S4X3_9GLOM|nr:hypothetical protein RclHR1_34240001 [Rhizophagus clarus]